ncbi:unnamed protein product [Rhizoctonia solani]|uniref:Transmembrane protein n=1 Tax=Rhizoctonia solani TaxID=456999 RepID=A0A8H3BJM0_9AGAM|nr:unnamed protein product [Rhizoctonia solani]
MDVRYSTLPGAPIEPQTLSSDADLFREGEETTKRAWIGNAMALVLHCIFSLGIALFILLYVENRHFNVSERFAQVRTSRGNETLPFNPTQSDIVTVLSSMIITQKLALSIWSTPLCWHIAVFLMENRGLRYRDLTTLVSYRVLTPKLHLRSLPAFITGTLLLASLAANLASPALTGAIAWVPDNQLAHGLAIEPVRFEDIDESTITKAESAYWSGIGTRQVAALVAVGLAGIGWGQDPEQDTLKRVSRSFAGLAVNSRIEHITLPYFKINSLHWIETVESIPIYDNTSSLYSKVIELGANSSPVGLPAFTLGSMFLVPNASTNWENDSLKPTVAHETRLLMLYYGVGDNNLTTTLPSNTFILTRGIQRYTFAWVTFSAGVERCKEYQCVISAPSTIRNDTAMGIEPVPHVLTFQAISMAIAVAVFQTTSNISLPSPTSINEYVEAVLVRAYSTSWESLSIRLDNSFNNASYIPAFPALLAQVNLVRVYLWLWAQLLVTCLGALFMIVQLRFSKYSFINDDDSLTAFYLDTSTIPMSGDAKLLKEGGVLKVEQYGDRLKVKVE